MDRQESAPLPVRLAPGTVRMLALRQMDECPFELPVSIGMVKMCQRIQGLIERNTRPPIALGGLAVGQPGHQQAGRRVCGIVGMNHEGPQDVVQCGRVPLDEGAAVKSAAIRS
jgi:hypothetical protein